MRRSTCLVVWALAALAFAAASAAVVPSPSVRFGQLELQDPSTRLGTVAETPEALTTFEAGRAGWAAFRAAHGADWRVWLDRRSGVPTLVAGPGIPFYAAGSVPAAAQLEATARTFISANSALLGVGNAELVWNPEGSGATDPDHRVLVFDRTVSGVPVEGERFVLYVTAGRLASFGATRWGAIAAVPETRYGSDVAYQVLRAYMGLTPQDKVDIVENGRKVLVASLPAGETSARYEGAVGSGVTHILAWRFALRVEGEPGTWVGKVDATTGKVIAFYDDDKYSRVKGGVYPVSNDQDCAEYGCEIADFPMPYVNVTVVKKATPTNDMGLFTCSKNGKNNSVLLSGPYVTVSDVCGVANISGSCGNDFDFGESAGTDCTSPQGLTGDTHAARSSYYDLNRIKEKGRYWLPSVSWLGATLTDRVNINSTCNAYWNGSVNFYKSGGGCRNTGEIAGVVSHEYGHGLDQNDGGGYDNPSEGYGDVISILQDRLSCVGRGFYQSGNCSGYGDACLNCTGIRDMDYAQHASNTPATPANFTAVHCGGGSGPCGREVHCESYVPAEAIFDLATRDLPATGLDTWSAWQLAEKLFYKSRQGSGGNAFNCSLPNSDGCGANSWFNEIRNADDDDGNLSNGTPHAAAIFAAFDRHGIACLSGTDPSNQSTLSCPQLVAPAISAPSTSVGSVTLSWDAVPDAARYLVLRSDIGCDQTANVIATVTSTSYTDDDLPSGFPVYYRIQAQGDNAACDGPVSACAPASAQ